ncbi:MAG: sulfatase-like hydrolase/transferase [Planctomycetaceae bacterium]|nr:sulfatase-like hydrolase/transferase [Planctomycetaceae bacterium]
MPDITRRELLTLLAGGAAAAALPGVLNAQAAAFAKRPNVLLIMADDLGYECLGAYGSKQYQTPRLDALAAGGLRFGHCYAQPLCTPSRVQIMTGQSNVRNYSQFGRLNKGEFTFAQMLKSAGYKTAVAGKWQLYAAGKGTHPTQAGFDEYCLWQLDRLGSRYWSPLICTNGKTVEHAADTYGPDVFCEFLCRFMTAHKDEPFFAYYPMVLTHDPFEPTPHSARRTGANKQKNFQDMVAYMDAVVGRLVAHLDKLHLRENTLILFTGDNGTGRAINSELNGRTIRGGKGSTTEAGMRVPLLANWPATIKAGGTCDDLVDFTDVLPTLAEACGAAVPAGVTLDGRSFLPQLQGRKGNPHEWLFCYYNPRPSGPSAPGVRFAFDRRWKLYDDGRLFDLSADVHEKSPAVSGDASSESAAARTRLRKALDSMPRVGAKIGR